MGCPSKATLPPIATRFGPPEPQPAQQATHEIKSSVRKGSLRQRLTDNTPWREYYNSLLASSPAREEIACQTSIETSSLANATCPSQYATLTPPGCRLRDV